MADPLQMELQETSKYFLPIESTMHDAMAIGLAAFLWQFCTVTAWAYEENTTRAAKFGERKYIFLPHGKVAGLSKLFNLIARAIEGMIGWKREN